MPRPRLSMSAPRCCFCCGDFFTQGFLVKNSMMINKVFVCRECFKKLPPCEYET